MSPAEAAAVFCLAAFASTAQSVTGFGFGLLIIPPLVLVLGPRDAVVLSTVLGTTLSGLMLSRVHAAIDWRLLVTLLAASVIGMPFGLAVLLTLDRDILQVVIAVGVIVMTVLLIRGFGLRAGGHRGPVTAGFLAGLFRMSAGLPGPPVVIYLQAVRLSPETARGVLTAFFVVSGLLGVATFAAEGSLESDLALLALPGAPAIALGWFWGNRLFARIDVHVFRRLVFVLLFASAFLALMTVFV